MCSQECRASIYCTLTICKYFFPSINGTHLVVRKFITHHILVCPTDYRRIDPFPRTGENCPKKHKIMAPCCGNILRSGESFGRSGTGRTSTAHQGLLSSLDPGITVGWLIDSSSIHSRMFFYSIKDIFQRMFKKEFYLYFHSKE